MKVTNPNDDRSILACVRTSPDAEGVWHEVPAGESVEVSDYVVASTLVEYGAKADPADLQAARELWAERNRQANSKHASAAASEGEILTRQQATVDVSTGTVTEPLAGSALADAVKAANEAGAGISSRLSADEKREALAVWQRSRGASSPVDPTRFEVDEAGELVLDDDGQPIPLAGPLDVDAANPVESEILSGDDDRAEQIEEEASGDADNVGGSADSDNP